MYICFKLLYIWIIICWRVNHTCLCSPLKTVVQCLSTPTSLPFKNEMVRFLSYDVGLGNCSSYSTPNNFESFFPFLNLKMNTLCQASQLSKCSAGGGDSTRRLKQVMKDVLKSENKVNGDIWMKPFQSHCQNTASSPLLFEFHSNLATWLSFWGVFSECLSFNRHILEI